MVLNFYPSKLLVILLCLMAQLSFGQATNAIITGYVQDEQGEGLPGATVVVRNESTGFQTGTVTNTNGEFKFNQLPLGGPYSIAVTFVGYGESIQRGYQLDQGDNIKADFRLRQASNELEEVIISGESLLNNKDKLGAVTEINARQIENLPTEGRNFTRLTSLSPLQGGGGINLGGQRRTSTNITIDGVNARNTLTAGEIGRGPYTVSQEAIREFTVATNNYDVTQGRQGGGSINAVTKSGTNQVEGSAFFYHRNDALQSQYTIQGNERTADFFTSQYGLSVGGPLVKDKLHYFVVYERQDEGSPLLIADLQTPDDENRIGISRSSLDQFVQIAREQYGVSNEQQTGQFDTRSTANNLFARLDWQVNDRHRLTLRNIYNRYNAPLSVGDNANIELVESYSDFTSNENSLLLSLRSNLTNAFTNELKLQYQHAERAFLPNSQLPAANIPRALVAVTSELPDGSTNTVNVQLGGQRFTPETNVENQLQLTNTAYLSLGKANLTVGTDNIVTFLETLLSNEQNGRFFFNSLEDFANLNPYRYAREVPLQGLPIVNQTVFDLSLFAQMDVNLTPNLNTIFGLRWDATAFMDAGAFNPVVFDELGFRTDNRPSDWNNIQPRAQATWNVKGKNRNIVRVGGGIFASQPHYYAQVNNIQNSGVLLGAIDVTGDQVPTPDFEAYRNDPSTVPGVPEGEEPFSTINAVSDDFEVPTIVKGNISFTHLISDRISVGVNALISHTYNNYVYQEANLVDDPYFTVPSEGRQVFVPAASISENGITDWTLSRESDRVGRALILTSDGVLNQRAIVFEGTARIGEDGYINVSYTRNQAKDNSSYNCCVANTSTFLPVLGDPRQLNYAFSNNHFSDKFIINGATPSFHGFTLGATLIGIGGERYSLMVNSNTSANGDFVLSNDLAYIFDPSNPETPANVAEAYNEILADPETAEGFKEYLRSSFGSGAARNGGINPFYANLDLRLLQKINLRSHGLELSVDIFNFTNLLNREWGRSYNFGSTRSLMRITGFDQATQRYDYNVNTGAGTLPINGTPWRLQVGVRYTLNQ